MTTITSTAPARIDEDENQEISRTSSCLQTFPGDNNIKQKNVHAISTCELEESLDDVDADVDGDENEDDSPDTYENHVPLQPIVVGYAFGPKKMSTMGSVMEKASLWDQREASFAATTPQQQQQQQQQQVVFTVGESDLGVMLGRLAASSDESMGTCTASYASSSTTTGRSRQAAWRLPPISFVPMESEEEILKMTTSENDDDGEGDGNNDKPSTCHIILHKLTEDILCTSLLAQQHTVLRDLRCVPAYVLPTLPLSPTEHAAVRRVHRLCHPPPGCLVLDDPVHVQTLMNRADICHTLSQCLSSFPRVQCPASTVVTDMEHFDQRKLQFPVILKPLIAAGTQASHHMAIWFADSPLLPESHDVDKWLAQEYRNHGAVLYKVYVLGDHVSVHPRRSLPDLPASGGTSLWFDSQRPYPRPIDFGLTSTASTTATKPLPPLTVHQVQPIAVALKEAFQLELFGFDVILDVDTDSENEPILWVVDVNYFPSYKEVPQFPALLAQFLTLRGLQQQQQHQSVGT